MVLHHANILAGGEESKTFVFGLLEKELGFSVKANPDFLMMEADAFGIDQARDLERWALGKPLGGEAKAALISARSVTFEAQNALLKVLEEPPLGTHIFIILESLGGLLPTFLSRVRVLESASPVSDSKSQGEKFLAGDIKKRLSMAKSLSRKEDKAGVLSLLREIEAAYYEKHKRSAQSAEAEALKKILVAKVFARARGSSPKMLLEWLSCVL